MSRPGYCVFINTFFQGAVPSVYDDEGKPVVFATRVEAEREIADFAMTVEEYVVEVDVWCDGSIVDADGNYFGVSQS